MRYTLRERMSLFRLALTGSGPLPPSLLFRVDASGNGRVQMPTNSCFYDLPAIGSEQENIGVRIPPEYPAGQDYWSAHWPSGNPLEDGDEGS